MTAPSALHQRCGAPDLMVLLPGARMTPQHMVDAGLFQAVQRGGLALDLMALDLHALEACNRAALRVLETDVLTPARAQYHRVWLGGISRGGQLALSYLAEQTGAINGLCLLAPYPGSRLTTNAVQRAGSVDAWVPTPEQLLDPEFRLWRWLKQPALPGPVFLGYGEQDRFADGMRLLADRLPQVRPNTLPGAHDWTVWQLLWGRFLDLGFFRTQP